MPSGNDDLAYITGSVLKWARLRSGLSITSVAEKVRSSDEQVIAWESGNSNPPFKTAQKLAKLLKIPFGFLFLPEPPKADLPLPDFRRKVNAKPTPDFMALLNDVLVKQDWYRDYITEVGEPPVKFAGKFTVESKVSDVAASIRQTLGITPALRQSVRSWAEYMSALARNAEEAGVLVMRSSVVGNTTLRKVSVEEVQGFAVVDSRAPVVFVNSGDYKASQIFTLVHELAHIWIGQSAISNPDESEADATKLEKAEAFCNRVAAEVLVPQEEFLKVWDGNDAEPAIARIAKWFWVSTLVVIRRAQEFQKITFSRANELKKQARAHMTARTGGGGDYYRNVVARMGTRLTYAVLGEVQHQRILLRDASRLLDMKVTTLLKFSELSR